MQTKNIDLWGKVDRKPRLAKGKAHHNKKCMAPRLKIVLNQLKNVRNLDIGELIQLLVKESNETVLLTVVELKTTFELIFKIDGKRADCVDYTLGAFISQLNGIENDIFKTITSNNGSGFSNFSDLSKAIDVYFCHPFASFERGTSENQHKNYM